MLLNAPSGINTGFAKRCKYWLRHAASRGLGGVVVGVFSCIVLLQTIRPSGGRGVLRLAGQFLEDFRLGFFVVIGADESPIVQGFERSEEREIGRAHV